MVQHTLKSAFAVNINTVPTQCILHWSILID